MIFYSVAIDLKLKSLYTWIYFHLWEINKYLNKITDVFAFM